MRGSRFGAAALATALAAGPLAAEGVLEVVPADAKAVILIGDVEKFHNASTNYLRNGCGLPVPEQDPGQMAQFLGSLGSHWKMNQGVAIAVMSLQPDGAAILLPVDDAAATAKDLGDNKDGDLTKFDLVGQEMVGYTAGKAAIFGKGADAVKAVKGSSKALASALGATGKGLLAPNQMFFYANLEALKPELDKLLENSDKLKDILKNAPGPAGQMSPEQIEKVLKQVVNGLGKEAKAIYGSLTFNEGAAVLKLGLEMKSDSKAAGALSRFKPSGGNQFGSLPDGDFVAALGLDLAAITSLNPDGQASQLDLKSFSSALAARKEGLALLGKVDTSKAAELNGQLKGLLGIALGMAQANAQGKVELKNSEAKVGGTEVSQVDAEFKGLPEEALKGIEAVFGSKQLTLQSGVIGEAIGFGIGANDPFAALQKSGTISSSNRVKSALAHLGNASPVLTVAVDPITALRLGKSVEAKVGKENKLANLQLPDAAGVPFIGAVTLESDAVLLHIVAPAATVKELVPAVQGIN